ncbi:hypothetical protein NPIL_38031 [Nephila pilipes]|uniref:Uncharacterized protein n=1 Tax=Nephila pilipes TaxID=299642 RepID=A0A8X6U2D1_NEPPI|nr:hypothetical protein NPIL_38031 [Nephila pilipes]
MGNLPSRTSVPHPQCLAASGPGFCLVIRRRSGSQLRRLQESPPHFPDGLVAAAVTSGRETGKMQMIEVAAVALAVATGLPRPVSTGGRNRKTHDGIAGTENLSDWKCNPDHLEILNMPLNGPEKKR